MIVAVAVILIVGTSAIISNFAKNETNTKIVTNETGSGKLGTGSGKLMEQPSATLPSNFTHGSSAIRVPAVDNDGNGVVTWLKVDSAVGEGRTLVNINQLLFWVDTQQSMQIAKSVAQNYTGYDLSKVDIIYTINTDASIIEGPSAGAALTVATVSALYNKTIDPDVMITGTINPNGTIGSVGGILEKAKAAKDVGSKLFLVPVGQSSQTYYQQERNCEKISYITYCTTDYKPVTINISEQAGIEVKEVMSINAALKYFLS